MLKVLVTCLLSLVLGVGSANAECAWVLWAETQIIDVSKNKSVNETEYTIVLAFSSEQECRKQAPNYLRGQRSRPHFRDADIEEGSGYFTWRVYPGASLTYRYVCLPDTIDPRGPKGGGR